jgi:Arc/MetJ-type ribon-helix-helix transcriptional regulator
MTIQFGPEQERVIDQAIEAGLIGSADEALDIAVDALRGRLRASTRPIDAEEWMRKFRAWAHSHPTTTPLLSDEAISRESIYRERGL